MCGELKFRNHERSNDETICQGCDEKRTQKRLKTELTRMKKCTSCKRSHQARFFIGDSCRRCKKDSDKLIELAKEVDVIECDYCEDEGGNELAGHFLCDRHLAIYQKCGVDDCQRLAKTEEGKLCFDHACPRCGERKDKDDIYCLNHDDPECEYCNKRGAHYGNEIDYCLCEAHRAGFVVCATLGCEELERIEDGPYCDDHSCPLGCNKSKDKDDENCGEHCDRCVELAKVMNGQGQWCNTHAPPNVGLNPFCKDCHAEGCHRCLMHSKPLPPSHSNHHAPPRMIIRKCTGGGPTQLSDGNHIARPIKRIRILPRDEDVIVEKAKLSCFFCTNLFESNITAKYCPDCRHKGIKQCPLCDHFIDKYTRVCPGRFFDKPCEFTQ